LSASGRSERDVPLLVTGGVDASDARAFLDAGAVAVGVGSALADPEGARRIVDAVR
jgi:2-dehydro-3-deoxyphosphogluconate aldolase / (4S)-4-hydroxy-2-oxoglutarate aldolase